MEWLIIGAVLGAAGFWLSSWARTKNISIKWYVWILVVLVLLITALTAMDYTTLIQGKEPATAGIVLLLFGGPALILAFIAVGLVWWENRKIISASKKS